MASSWAQMTASKMTSSWSQIMALSLVSSIASSWAPMVAMSSYNDGIKLSNAQNCTKSHKIAQNHAFSKEAYGPMMV
eukprot:995812-Ditylum_brightwellii.AAC.1